MRYTPHLNPRTLIASLQSCANHTNLTKGKQIHAQMLTNGHLISSPHSSTSLINMYSKCNSISSALSIFHSSPCPPNAFTYNAIISGLVANNLSEAAIAFYLRMREEGVIPDNFTFPCLIKACSRDVLGVTVVHGLLFKSGLELDLYIGSALIRVYSESGFVGEARRVFDGLLVRDVVLWNAMINGFAKIGEWYEALEIFRKMCDEGVGTSKFTITGILSVFVITEDSRNGRVIHGLAIKTGHDGGVAVSNALIDMYGKCKYIEGALRIFETMSERDVFSWNCVLCVHERYGDHVGTLRFFHKMLSAGYKPDLVSFTTVLPACAHLAALKHGREIHSYMIVNGFVGKDSSDTVRNNVYIGNIIMDMHTKCGSLREARLVFDRMGFKDVASWNIMLNGYGMNGFCSEALNLFSTMCEMKFKPNEVSFLGVLSACSHGGFVEKGREFISQMEAKYEVVPTIEHYTCVVDMLGRAGHLEEAYELLSAMPVEADSVIWRAFLAACQLHGNPDLAAQKMFELQTDNCGSYVLMSNLYSAAGRYEEVSELRHKMRRQNVLKAPGCSWI